MNNIKSKALLNLSSTAIPMLLGLVVIPILIKEIGIERFGILSIAWMLIGYFGVLDMGLGRALTFKVAQNIGQNKTENIRSLVWSTIFIVGLFGIFGTLVLTQTAHYLTHVFFKITEEFQQEAYLGVYWLSLAIPFTIISTALIGVLEGQQHFKWSAIIKAPSSALMFLAPLAASKISPSLDYLLASLFLVRFATTISLVLITHKTLKTYKKNKFHWMEFKSMLYFSGWLTISNIISPAMVYFDRFYITSVLSASVVAFYTTPFDLLIKTLIVPLALVGVMFTVFSTDWTNNKKKVIKQYKKSIFIVIIVMLPIVITNYLLAKTGLAIWISPEFAEESYKIMQILGIGFFMNALAAVPFALIQGIGRADITAKFHLFEAPLYIFLIWFFIDKFELIGAAYAWTLRAGIDCLLLYFAASRFIKS